MNDNLNNNAGGLIDTKAAETVEAAAEEFAAEAVAADTAGAPEPDSPEAVLAARAAAEAKAAEARAARRTRTPKPLRVLNTSLGVVLAANLLLVPAVYAESKAAEPQIIEWSNEDVKTYFDPSADWSIPLPEQLDKPGATPTPTPSAGVGTGGTGAGAGTAAPVVYNHGLDWTDLMLYHLIFNSGGSYSSSGWSSSRPSYDYRTKKPYSVPTYDSTKFQNKQTANSTVKPKTSNTTGAFNSKSTINSRNNSSKSSSTTGSSSTKSSSSTGSSGSGSTSTKSGSSSSSSSSGSVSSGSSSKSSSSSSGSIGGKSGGFSSSGSSSSGS
ncbi:hypothetical protein ACI48J_21550 [Paenibacillus chitinolyticus]|uniref:hypothetical protein n=1 Tax=Paenibacillus chitinolyticus TaxID=79263 RepID=UPI0038698DCF